MSSSLKIACKYIESSWEPNMIMSGLGAEIDEKYATWTPQQVKALRRYIEMHEKSFQEKRTLFRGTRSASPILEPLQDVARQLERFADRTPLVNASPMSTSTSRAIAKEFAGTSGFIHVLHVAKGVTFVDFEDVSCSQAHVMKGKAREKEVLIVPGHTLVPLRRYKNALHWLVAVRR
jgi:hypothetical protein